MVCRNVGDLLQSLFYEPPHRYVVPIVVRSSFHLIRVRQKRRDRLFNPDCFLLRHSQHSRNLVICVGQDYHRVEGGGAPVVPNVGVYESDVYLISVLPLFSYPNVAIIGVSDTEKLDFRSVEPTDKKGMASTK